MKKYLKLLVISIRSMIMLTGCIAFQASDYFYQRSPVLILHRTIMIVAAQKYKSAQLKI